MAVDTKSGKKSKAPAGNKPVKSLFDEKPKQDDLAQLWQDVQARPMLYVGIAVFLVACLFAGFLYRTSAIAKRKDVITAYAQALDKEEPAEQLAALEPLTQGAAKKNDEVVYITGETAYRAGQYDKAKAAFARMRTEFKDSTYTPDAIEGLGNIAENAKEYDAALTYYKEVRDSFGGSFAARRQPTNIAKVEEHRGHLAEAVAAYREQMQLFAGSTLADEASAALTRLEKSNPELFPKAEAMPPAATTPAATGVETPAATAPTSPATTDISATAAPSSSPDLNLKLQTPDVTGESSATSDSDLNLKLNVPDVGTSAPAETAPAETPPAAK